jgi:steroid 5-alpha reductase family enzyme
MTDDRRRLLVAVSLAYLGALGVALVAGFALSGRQGRHLLLATGVADAAATLAIFAASVRHDNASVYDPYWSVAPVPIVAAWLAAAAPGASTARSALVAALVAGWSVRLTWNCLARWRSLADEDFRYREIRARTGRLYWPAALFTIHLFPTAWVFLGLLPLYAAVARPSQPLGWLDGAAALLTAGAILLEGLADAQLRRFRRARRDPEAALETGLWAVSRHPNYLGEVLFWWGLWLFGVAADPSWWWTVAGPLAITALFTFVSVPWMERHLEARHPGWGARRAAVPALWPFARRTLKNPP